MTTILPLPTDGELSPEARDTLSNLPPLNVFRMVARAPASLPAFADLARSVLIGSELDAKAREIAVLRVAHVTGSAYVWTQHLALARLVGVTEEQIERIGRDEAAPNLDPDEALLCRVAEEMTRGTRLSEEALAAAVDRYGARQAAELVFCCAYFNLVTRFVDSMRVPFEGSGGGER